MNQQWHYSPATKKVSPCKAGVRNCPVAQSVHFTSAHEANNYQQQILSKENEDNQTISRTQPTPRDVMRARKSPQQTMPAQDTDSPHSRYQRTDRNTYDTQKIGAQRGRQQLSGNNGNVQRGTFKTGQQKFTSQQVKKHYTSFSDSERKFLSQRAQNIKSFRYSKHLQQKMDNEGLTVQPDMIMRALRQTPDTIIEYNQKPTTNYKTGEQGLSRRILVRSKDSAPVNVNGRVVNCNLCAVVDIDKHTVVTAYWNADNDNHTVGFNDSRYSDFDIDLT